MKKSILILTDLSENAKLAAEAGLMLAGKLGSNILLLNCSNTISVISYYPVVPAMNEPLMEDEDRKSKLNEVVNHLKKKYNELFPERGKLVISSIVKEGDLSLNTKEVLKHHHVEMIVMGAKSGSPTDHFLFGSDTKSIVNHSPVPVLVVPPGKVIRPALHIIFATNFLDQDIYVLNYLAQLRRQLTAHLEIVHIRQYGQVAQTKNIKVRHAIEDLRNTDPAFVTYNEVYGKHLMSRLNHYCKEKNADILALSHQHHSLLFKAFREGTVDKSLSAQIATLLIIPELQPEHEIDKDVHKDLSNIIF